MRLRSRTLLVLSLIGVAALSCARGVTGPRDDTWRLLPGHVETFRYAPFRSSRQCWVYLPPGYALSTARYPVLYFNDGESVFDSDVGMHVNRIAEDLIRRGEIEPLIIVAISNLSATQRYLDYTPWAWGPSPPQGGGDFYLRAVRDTLKPEIDRRFRTEPDRENTAMAGVSLSGLLSTYALFAYDSTFGRAGAFSPTYGWAFESIVPFVGSHGHPRWPSRLYQDTGTVDDNDIQEMEMTLTGLGFLSGQDLMSVTATGGDHGPGSWAHRVPDMLRFLFPPAR